MADHDDDPAPEVPWDKVELGFRRVRAVRRALLILAVLVVVLAVLVQLY